MKVSAYWLRHFVNPENTFDEIAEALTTAGVEVDEVEHWPASFDHVYIARVQTVEPHPVRDDISVCRIETDDSGALRQVVCGASNVAADICVPFAAVGARLPDGRQIETSDFAGQTSEGMLCSPAELGLGTEDARLWRLPDDAPVGSALATYLALPDDSLVLDLTPNRGDCLSMLGIAREVALSCGSPAPTTDIATVTATVDDSRDVSIQAPEACAVYRARTVRDIEPAADAPPWLSERLRRAGIGCVNAPVDITNYVMLAVGQPMHAFDADQLVGDICVRYARAGETIVTLDAVEISLQPQTLVIADVQGPVAVAGVIGGLRTAVTAATRNLVFEAACFTPQAVAGQGRLYKIQTDSLHRFERGVDPEMAEQAIEYACDLCLSIIGGQPGPTARADGNALSAYRPAIELSSQAIERILGQPIEPSFVTQTLTALGLDVTEQDEGCWRAVPPSWRFDLAIAADLIEEVARIYGYEQIATQSARVALAEPVNRLADRRLPLDVLRARGYSEAITYSFIDPELDRQIQGDQGALALDNPIADTMGVMRRSLIAGLVQAYLYNHRRHQRNIRLYENGLCFEPDASAEHGVAQIDRVAGLVAGDAEPPHWDSATRGVDFFDAKGDVEALFAASGRADVWFEAGTHPALKPGRTAQIWCGQVQAGWLGQLADHVTNDNKNSHQPYVFEIDSRFLHPTDVTRHTQISDQPQVVRDLALVVAAVVPAGRLIDAVESNQASALQSVDIVDVFHGGELEAGCKSVALRLIFQDKTSTLTSEAVDGIVSRIMSSLTDTYGAHLRGT